MDESLTQRRRVDEEVLRDVKSRDTRIMLMGNHEREGRVRKVTANYVPAAAVIRRWQALSGITGRKGDVGGYTSQM